MGIPHSSHSAVPSGFSIGRKAVPRASACTLGSFAAPQIDWSAASFRPEAGTPSRPPDGGPVSKADGKDLAAIPGKGGGAS